MIKYDGGKWYLSLLFHVRGSVVPRALAMSIPNAGLSLGIWYLFQVIRSRRDQDDDVDVGQVWVGFNFIIGFLVAFRTQQAYARWWEACGALQMAKCELFNAFSSVCSFCTTKPELRNEVDIFQQTMVRLTSMFYAAAMHQLSTSGETDFEILDVDGLERSSLEFLKQSTERVEILAEWILRLVVLNINSGVIPIGPPIIAVRTFSELARAMINFYNLRKICEFMFPFACAQMISIMLLVHWMLTPFVTALVIDSGHWAAIVAFICTFSLWSVNFMASEMERPFGNDYGDIPTKEMTRYLNRVLLEVVHEKAQTPPKFDTRVCTSKSTGKYVYYKKPRIISMAKLFKGGARQSQLFDFLGEQPTRPMPADLASLSTASPPDSDAEDKLGSGDEAIVKPQDIVVTAPETTKLEEALPPTAPPVVHVEPAAAPAAPKASPTSPTPSSGLLSAQDAIEASATPTAPALAGSVDGAKGPPAAPRYVPRRNLSLAVPELKAPSAHCRGSADGPRRYSPQP